MKKIMKILVVFLALFVLISCGEKTASKDSAASSEASTAAKKRDILNVTASIPPQAFIIKSVGKDKVKVNVMLPPSSAPETYEPGPQKMADLKDSTIYFKGGLPFEGFFLERLAKDYKNVQFADMMKGIKFHKMEGHGGCPHCGGKECPCKGDKECCKKHGGCACLDGKCEGCADCKCGCKEGKECGCKDGKGCAECKCGCNEGQGCGCHGSEMKKEAEKEEECGVDACSLPGFDAPKEEKHEHHHHDGMHEGCPHHKEHHGDKGCCGDKGCGEGCCGGKCEGCADCKCGCKEGKGCDCKDGKGCADCKCGCGCCGKHPFPPMPGHFPEMHDPHVWLDPMNLIIMTDNTVAELSAVDPENSAFYRENGETLKAEIKKVNDEVAAQLKEVEGKSFVVHHPAFGYFAERFGLKQVPLEIEGKEPGAVDMAKVVDFIRKNNAKAVFMQAQIPDSVIKSVAEETKVRVITLDPLAENVLENIKKTANEIKGALIDEK
jgi:ABC-type Zn uptake system ZnuABC Zn-binding protein ZnuA